MKLHLASKLLQTSMMLILWTVHRAEAAALRGSTSELIDSYEMETTDSMKIIAAIYEVASPEHEDDMGRLLKAEQHHLRVDPLTDPLMKATFDCNVTFPESDKSDNDDQRFLQSYTLSEDETRNGEYVQYERVSRGLQAVYWSGDLILEAQRWSQYLASTGSFVHRNPLGENIDSGWRSLAENLASNPSISYDGAHTSLMNSEGHRANILNSNLNRIGVGVTRVESGNYILVHIFKQV
jgi:uncharacterized protein YkwD